MAYKNYNRSFKSAFGKATKGFAGGQILTFGILGFVLLFGYGLFKKFMATSPFGSASDGADKLGSSTLTTQNAAATTGLNGLKDALAKQGLVVNTQHIALGNQINQLIDNTLVDGGVVVKMVQSMSFQTFQLVCIAYGQRELRNYRNSHLFNPASWADLFSEKKMYGTLKFHLDIVLSSSQLSVIASYLNKVV
jgi:hypothetical protein